MATILVLSFSPPKALDNGQIADTEPPSVLPCFHTGRRA